MAESEPSTGMPWRKEVLRNIAIVASIMIALLVLGWALLRSGPGTSSADSAAPSSHPFDPCETLRDEDPHCGWQPHWNDYGASVNPIDGTRTEILAMQSTTPDGMDDGRLHYAELRICFENGELCRGSNIGVGFSVDGTVAPLNYDSEGMTAVRVRFDDKPPVRSVWGISANEAALYPRNEKQFLAEMIRHNKLFLEFSYFEKAPRTLTFEVAGLAEEMRAHNLGALELK